MSQTPPDPPSTPNGSSQTNPPQKKNMNLLTLTALGVVFGDIGTSPLYAVRECFHGPHAIGILPENIFGVLSLIFWSLFSVVSIKYLFYVLKADNRGEGGIIALASLVRSKDGKSKRGLVAAGLGLFGVALLYGDGMITPAISVLSALEGLNVITPFFNPFIIPLTITILIGLFLFQKQGTAQVGLVFGPIMLVWFTVIGLMGLFSVIQSPEVFKALDPRYGLMFLFNSGKMGFFVLGAVFLVVTGSEALYADLGHFGIKPIQRGWFFVAAPGLVLNYFGQGALLLRSPEAAVNPFYQMVPSVLLIPLVLLATMATVIASQAVITGVFSVTRQTVQLGYLPRLKIIHTSSSERGQIYMPEVNMFLAVATISLVLGFRESSNLAAAYGIAVSIDMLMTTFLAYRVAVHLWKWKLPQAILATLTLLIIDIVFLGANLLKISDGGWVPLAVGFVFMFIFVTWKKGQTALGDRFKKEALGLSFIIDECKKGKVLRVPGIAVYFSATPGIVPPAMLHNMKHNKVVHERNVFVTVLTEEVPHIPLGKRLLHTELSPGFDQIFIHYGFMQHPEIPVALERAGARGLNFNPQAATYFISRNKLVPTKKGIKRFSQWIFSILHRNALGTSDFFQLPSNQVIEIGRIMKI